MPTTRKQKKARKSRGIEMLSDLENLDIMLGENHFNRNERDGSVSSNFGRRPGSTSADELGSNGENRHSATRDIDPGNNADYGRNSIGGNSSAEINKLSSELNSRLSRELDDMMCSVNSQIQRAISDAISNQVLPQIQSALSAGSGHMTQNRWDIPSERPEINSEGLQNTNPKDSSTSKHNHDHQNDGGINLNAYDMVTGDNESPNQVPEFLTGRILSRNHLDQSYEDINLNTTIPAQERPAPVAESDPITRLADVLTNMQNRPTAQQLTIRPVNSNTMTFDGKSEKFELFEDLFHTMIKMQPEMTEQMKINHFHSLLRKNALQTFRNINSTNRQTHSVYHKLNSTFISS